jgi:hypothetical protein
MRTEITIGQVAQYLALLEIGCRKCDRYGRLSIASLITKYGADQALPGLLKTLVANCPRQRAYSIDGVAPVFRSCRASSGADYGPRLFSVRTHYREKQSSDGQNR